MNHQIVNLRTRCPVVFGDRDQQQAYEAECERARAAQTSRYAVAPGQQLATDYGRRLGPGEAVRLSDFDNESRPAWAKLEKLVNAGIVLESDTVRDEDDAP